METHEAIHFNETSEEGKDHIKHFPEEIVQEVLFKLQIKSLQRFKSVCKKWRAIIENPVFITRHIELGNTAIMGPHCHLYYHPNELHAISTTTSGVAILSGIANQVVSLDDAPNFNHVRKTINGVSGHFVSPSSGFYILENDAMIFGTLSPSPINGVYCFLIVNGSATGCTTLLWNPGTNEVHVPPTIPPPELPYPLVEWLVDDNHPMGSTYNLGCGFGYDPRTKDFKVLVITMRGDPYGYPLHHYYFHEYSLALDAWKQLDPHKIFANHPSFIEVQPHGGVVFVDHWIPEYAVYAKGACHWPLSPFTKTTPWRILSYDFTTTKFRVYLVPGKILDSFPSKMYPKLTTLHDCLALVIKLRAEDMQSCVYDVYIMNGDAGEESWMQAHTIRVSSLSSLVKFIGIIDDEFFLQDENGKVVSYCLSAKIHENAYFEYCCIGLDSRLQIFPYRGSLLPLKPRKIQD